MTKKLLFSLVACITLSALFVGCGDDKKAGKTKPTREYNAMVVETEEKPQGVKSDFITPVPMKDYSDKPSGKVKD